MTGGGSTVGFISCSGMTGCGTVEFDGSTQPIRVTTPGSVASMPSPTATGTSLNRDTVSLLVNGETVSQSVYGVAEGWPVPASCGRDGKRGSAVLRSNRGDDGTGGAGAIDRVAPG